MKCNLSGVLSDAPKLLTVVALSALLVACGGGSGDSVDGGDTDGSTDDVFGQTDGEIDAGETDAGAGELDADGDGISDEDELDICKGRGGSDPGSNNAAWNDNCTIEYQINSDTAGTQLAPFYNSTYAKGIQRVLYCRESAGVAVSIDEFADGFYGENTYNAVRAFQEAEGLIVDGIVGPESWGRMQVLVEDPAVTVLTDDVDAYNGYGVVRVAEPTTEINCEAQLNFYGRFSTDATNEDEFEGWELTKAAGVDDKGSFSIATP